MLIGLLQLLLQFVFDAFGYALLARFLMQWRRVPFNNQLGRFVVKVTDWLVIPTRRIVPSLYGADFASLLLLWLEQIILGWLLAATTIELLVTTPVGFAILAYVAVFKIIRLFFWLLTIASLLLWINPQLSYSAALHQLVEPFFARVRGKLPSIAGFDLSPLLFLFLLQVVLVGIAWIERSLFPLIFAQPMPFLFL